MDPEDFDDYLSQHGIDPESPRAREHAIDLAPQWVAPSARGAALSAAPQGAGAAAASAAPRVALPAPARRVEPAQAREHGADEAAARAQVDAPPVTPDALSHVRDLIEQRREREGAPGAPPTAPTGGVTAATGGRSRVDPVEQYTWTSPLRPPEPIAGQENPAGSASRAITASVMRGALPTREGDTTPVRTATGSVERPAAPAAPGPSGGADIVDLTGGAGARRAGGGSGAARGSRATRGTVEAPRELTNEEFIEELGTTPSATFREAFPRDYEEPSLYDREREQINDAARNAMRAQELVAQEAAQSEENIREIERERVARQAQHDAAINEATQRYRAALDRVASERQDPARWFHDRGAGGTVLAAITMAVGEFAAQMTGGSNAAAEIIQGAIRDDLHAQEVNLAHMRDSVESQRGLLGLMQQQFESRESAAQAAEALQLEAAAQRARARAAELGSVQAREQGETLALELERRAAEAESAARTAAVDRALEQRAQLARIRRDEARATREERRAMGAGGPAAPEAPSGSTMSDVNRALDAYDASGGTDREAHRERVAAIYRIPMELMPPVGGRFPEASTGDTRQRMDALEVSLRELEELIPEANEDIPGIGTIDSVLSEIPLLGRAWAGDQGQLIRQRGIGTVRRFLRIESGGAITDDEIDDELAARGLTTGASESTFREGMRQLRRDVDARLGRFARIGSTRARADRDIAAAGAQRVE